MLVYYPALGTVLVLLSGAGLAPAALVPALCVAYALAVVGRICATHRLYRRARPSPFVPYLKGALRWRAIFTGPTLLAWNLLNLAFAALPTAPVALQGAVLLAVLILISWATPQLIPFLCAKDRQLTRAAADVAARAGVARPCAYLVPTLPAGVPNAFVMGFFNRNVFVTDDLWRRRDGALVPAVIAHELGHRRLHHPASTLIFVPLWVLAMAAGQAALPVILLVYVALAAITRRNEYAADAFAATVVGADLMIGALKDLDGLTRPEGSKPRRTSIFDSHPSLGRRIQRLERLRGANGATDASAPA